MNTRVSAVVAPMLTGALVASLALGGRGAANAAADPANATPNARIVFARGSDLYVTSSDGSGLRRLSRNAGQPAVSPDARRIAFVRDRTIWVMRRDGSGQRRLTSGHEDITPAWSPDGRRIYFSRLVERRDELGSYEFAWPIFRMRADGSVAKQLTHPDAWDHGVCHVSPAPSPDGRVIAFATFSECDRGYGVGISAIGPNGSRVDLKRFDMTDAGFDPAWSSDGRSLAFTVLNEWEGSVGIAVARSDGSRAIRVYRRPAAKPAWSPDGEWIALVRTTSRTGTIWLIRRDGTGLRRLSGKRYETDPAWLPSVR